MAETVSERKKLIRENNLLLNIINRADNTYRYVSMNFKYVHFFSLALKRVGTSAIHAFS